MRNVSRVLLLAAALASAPGALAQRTHREPTPPSEPARTASIPHEWTELGERVVDGPCDHDSIQLGSRSTNAYSQVRLVVEASDLELYDIVVTFADGTTYSPQTRLTFHEGDSTRQIDLPGTARAIRRVDFRYGNLPGGGRARLVLLGR